MFGGLIGLVVSLASQVVVASTFGASTSMDAYLTALVIPTYLQALLIGGLSFVFVPAFVRNEGTNNVDDAWSLAGTLLWLTGVTLTVLAIASTFLARTIIDISAPGLNPEKSELAARMLTVMMYSLPFTGVGSLAEGIQHTRSKFFMAAAAPAIGSLGNLTTLLMFHSTLGPMSLAWGSFVASMLQACVTLIPILRHGWARRLPLRDTRVRELGQLIWPFIFFGILTRCAPLFERYFASSLPDGDLSYLGYATKIARIVMVLLGAGIATTMFPAMARAYAQYGEQGLAEEVMFGLRLTLAIAVPVLAIASVLATPIVQVLFERGAFDHATTLSVSRILPLVMIDGVLVQMMGNVVGRAFYVTKDTFTLNVVNAAMIGLYILLAWLLIGWAGYVGLAAAQALYWLINLSVGFALMLWKLRSFKLGQFMKSALMIGSASMMAFLVAWLVVHLFPFLPALVQLIVSFGLAVLSYMFVLGRLERELAMSLLDITGVPHLLTRMRQNVLPAAEVPTGD
jgi:putative peptidoglycan lipid II flippase